MSVLRMIHAKMAAHALTRKVATRVLVVVGGEERIVNRVNWHLHFTPYYADINFLGIT